MKLHTVDEHGFLSIEFSAENIHVHTTSYTVNTRRHSGYANFARKPDGSIEFVYADFYVEPIFPDEDDLKRRKVVGFDQHCAVIKAMLASLERAQKQEAFISVERDLLISMLSDAKFKLKKQYDRRRELTNEIEATKSDIQMLNDRLAKLT